MFSVPKFWNSTRISHFEDLELPMSKNLRSDNLGVNPCFLSLHAETGPEFIISTIWNSNPLQMWKEKDILKIWSHNHLQIWIYDISDIIEPQSMFSVPKWTTGPQCVTSEILSLNQLELLIYDISKSWSVKQCFLSRNWTTIEISSLN